MSIDPTKATLRQIDAAAGELRTYYQRLVERSGHHWTNGLRRTEQLQSFLSEWPHSRSSLCDVLTEVERESQQEGTAFHFLLTLYRRAAGLAEDKEGPGGSLRS